MDPKSDQESGSANGQSQKVWDVDVRVQHQGAQAEIQGVFNNQEASNPPQNPGIVPQEEVVPTPVPVSPPLVPPTHTSGIKTTEFWLSLLAVVASSAIPYLGNFPKTAQFLGLGLSVLATLGYTASRTAVKKGAQ